MTPFTARVATLCEAEFARWSRGNGVAHEKPYASYVGEYWKVGVGVSNRDGNTTYIDEFRRKFRPAWSAAFISYIFRRAGAGNQFCYSQAHVHYIVETIRNAECLEQEPSFVGQNPRDAVPKVGDLICIARGSREIRFRDILELYGSASVPDGKFFPCHADVVVNVTTHKRILRTIGGNLGKGTVTERYWRIDETGRIADSSVLCVVDCRL